MLCYMERIEQYSNHAQLMLLSILYSEEKPEINSQFHNQFLVITMAKENHGSLSYLLKEMIRDVLLSA